MKRQLVTAYVLFSVLTCPGQLEKLKPLNIGDRVPETEWGNFFIYPLQEKIHDLRGKLVILDFWNIYCIPCFEGMKKLDSLQRYFDQKIQIILITQNNSQEVERTFKRIRMSYPNLPMITEDTNWVKLFPHQSVPHHVWIDASGKVKFVSYGYNTSFNTIHAVLEEKEIDLTIKSENAALKKDGPLLLSDGNLINNYMCYYSAIMRRVKEFGGGEVRMIKDTINKFCGIRLMNRTVISLYQEAFGNEFRYRNRMLFEVCNPDAFNLPEDTLQWDAWFEKNLYCYELIVQLHREKELNSIMRQDLNRFFPFEAVIEKRKIPCLVLIRISEEDKICSKGGSASKKRVNEKIIINNLSLHSSLFSMIVNANADLPTPVIDETNYIHNIDIEVTNKLNNAELLRMDLKKYGLDLISEEREIEMLIIRDKKKW